MTLNDAWFVLIVVLVAGYAVLDGFDLGVGVLHLQVARTDPERRTSLNSIGPVWDGNEVWLLTAGGALFAAFPPVYATVFSGFYLALMLVLFALIARAVSLEVRSKEDSPRWRAAWDRGFSIGSAVAALLFGVAAGNVVRGLPIDAQGEWAGSFLGLLNPFALLVGAAAFSMMTMHGALWLNLKTEGELQRRAAWWAMRAALLFASLDVLCAAYALVEAPRLFERYRGAPAAWGLVVLLGLALAAVPLLLRGGRALGAFLASGASIVLLVAVLAVGLYPALAPSRLDPAWDLTIHNAASSPLTLKAMLILALVGMPLVLGYTAYIYRVFRGKVKIEPTSY